jgi:hypothetical protein
MAWQPIETAPKDGTRVWIAFKADLVDMGAERWQGVQIAARHEGFTPSDCDMGWSVAAPVGHGGLPDKWIAGWMPLPAPPSP